MTVEFRGDDIWQLNQDIGIVPMLLGSARPNVITVDTTSSCTPITVRAGGRNVICIVPANLQCKDDQNRSFSPLTLGEAILGCGLPITAAGQQLINCLNEQIGGPAGLSLRYQEIVQNLQTRGHLVLDCKQFPVVTGDWDWLPALIELAEMPDELEPRQKVFWMISRNLLEAVVWMEATKRFPSQADSEAQLRDVIAGVVNFRRQVAGSAYLAEGYRQ